MSDEAFSHVLEQHRTELRVHGYRMLGSLADAEDVVQETYLRAWRRRSTFEGRSTFRAWLYRIATNACIEVLRRRSRVPIQAHDGHGELPPVTELPWLGPLPDSLLDSAATNHDTPDELVVTRQTIEMAYLVAIQLLPPKQRATLILRDVLCFSAAETAAVLDTTVKAINSALGRARATMRRRRPSTHPHRDPTPTADERLLLRRYMEAHERADPTAIVAILRQEVRMSVSPYNIHLVGRDEVSAALLDGMNARGRFRCIPVAANRQPATALYLRRRGRPHYDAFSIILLGMSDGGLVDITTFARPDLFESFGLPLAMS